MAGTLTSRPRTGTISWSRRILVLLAGLFTLGAFAQFFLVGVSFFDDAARWQDHATLGHNLGLLPWVMWIPAVLGKAGARIIIGTFLLFFLFEMQYAFIEIDNSMVNALHPLNGSMLLVLSFWITLRSVGLLRHPHDSEPSSQHMTIPTELPDKLEGSSS